MVPENYLFIRHIPITPLLPYTATIRFHHLTLFLLFSAHASFGSVFLTASDINTIHACLNFSSTIPLLSHFPSFSCLSSLALILFSIQHSSSLPIFFYSNCSFSQS